MFRLISTDDGRELPFEYLPASAMKPEYGKALYLNASGKLAVASGTNLATHICCREESANVTAGTIIPVVKIPTDAIWETEGAASMVVGTGYDVASGGMSVEAASTNAQNNFVLTDVDGTTVRGRFVK